MEIKECMAHTLVEEDIAHLCLSQTGQNKLINMMIGDVILQCLKLLPGEEALQNRWLIFTLREGETREPSISPFVQNVKLRPGLLLCGDSS